MKKKLQDAWMKVGKALLWMLAAALCACAAYLVFVHRDVIIAAIKGEPLPERPESGCPFKCCGKGK